MTSQRVFLLGAGFSMAVSTNVPDEWKMPSMWQLSDAVVGQLRGSMPNLPSAAAIDTQAMFAEVREAMGEDHLVELMQKAAGAFQDILLLATVPGYGTPLTTNFEQWLSYLAEAPPWLSPSDQARNRAAFLDVSKAISSVMESRQAMTVLHQKGICPDWLARIVRRWHVDAATVITFNYDQFVELAWLAHAEPIPPRERSWDLYAAPLMPLTSRAGVAPPVYSVPGGFRLLKLHGSLGWWYSGPDSPPSDPVYDQGVRGPGWTREGLFPIGTPFGSLTAEKEPLIVPPAAVKSPYYSNSILRGLWKAAASQLGQADEVVIMGFSLPATDLLVSSMLSTTVGRECIVTPVNPDPGIIERVCATFNISSDDSRLNQTYVGGSDAISRWVDDNA